MKTKLVARDVTSQQLHALILIARGTDESARRARLAGEVIVKYNLDLREEWQSHFGDQPRLSRERESARGSLLGMRMAWEWFLSRSPVRRLVVASTAILLCLATVAAGSGEWGVLLFSLLSGLVGQFLYEIFERVFLKTGRK
jgi:hypothetical protein